MRQQCSNCNWPIHSNLAITITCPRCKKPTTLSGIPSPQKIEKTPRWVRIVRRLRIPSDIGIGDTLQRQFAKYGGERFKEWATKLGIDCGCTERQNHYNKKYPYQ